MLSFGPQRRLVGKRLCDSTRSPSSTALFLSFWYLSCSAAAKPGRQKDNGLSAPPPQDEKKNKQVSSFVKIVFRNLLIYHIFRWAIHYPILVHQSCDNHGYFLEGESFWYNVIRLGEAWREFHPPDLLDMMTN